MLKKVLEEDNSQSRLEDELMLKAWLKESKTKLKIDDEAVIVPTFFNPNRINEDKWIQLGFKKKIAERIINYRNKGGSFKKKEDLLKIYGINQKLVNSYFDYIILPAPKTKPKSPTLKKVMEKMVIEKESVKFDLNLADSTQLQIVKGIGPVLSGRIIKYREMLGGFISADQIREVYGIKEDVYQRMLSHFGILLKTTTKKISINQDSISLLAKHPYLDFNTSRSIVKYRIQHGDYHSLEELKNIHTLSDSLFQKIAPYLDTESSE